MIPDSFTQRRTLRLLFLATSFLSVVALFSACTTGEKMSSLEPGMTRQQVVGMLGRPDAVRSSGPYEQLEYTHRLITGWSWDRSDFNVILKNGRVVEFGHGEIRDRSPRMVVVPPIQVQHSGTVYVDY